MTDCQRQTSDISNKYVRARVQFEKGDARVDAGLDEGMRQVLGRCAAIRAMEEGLDTMRKEFARYAGRFGDYLTSVLPDAATEEMNWRYGTSASANDRNSPGARTAATEAHSLLKRYTVSASDVPWMQLLAPYISPPPPASKSSQSPSTLPPIARTARVTLGGGGTVTKKGGPSKPAAGARDTRTSPARKPAHS